MAVLGTVVVLAACSKKEEAPMAVTPAPAVTAAVAQACGKVSVANMNWQSAEVLAHIDNIILTSGFGCDVELVPGDTMPTLTAMMEKGKPDVAPEAWINAVRQPLDAAVKAGTLHYAATSLKDGGVEGIVLDDRLVLVLRSVREERQRGLAVGGVSSTARGQRNKHRRSGHRRTSQAWQVESGFKTAGAGQCGRVRHR